MKRFLSTIRVSSHSWSLQCGCSPLPMRLDILQNVPVQIPRDKLCLFLHHMKLAPVTILASVLIRTLGKTGRAGMPTIHLRHRCRQSRNDDDSSDALSRNSCIQDFYNESKAFIPMVTIRNSASPVTRATAEMEEKRRTCLDYISFAVALRSALRCQLIPVSSVVHIYFSVTQSIAA